jgi:hypothetical protein
VAGRQHGLITSAQLNEAGLSRAGVSKRAAKGRLHRIHRGVYAVGHTRLSQEGRWMAAVLAAGDGAVLSHLAAAKLWNIWRRRVDGIDVTAPHRHQLPTSEVRPHYSRRLDAKDTTTRNGIPVTTVARLLVDLTDELNPYQLANVIHEAAFRNLYDARATEAAMARANGRHNLPSLQAAVRAHAAGSAGTKSDLEDRFLQLALELGHAEPLVNTKIGPHEVDFYWPELNLTVEIDGPGHTRPRTRAEDEARDRFLKAKGIETIRFTATDLTPQTVRELAPHSAP